jgi:hypothetical protein
VRSNIIIEDKVFEQVNDFSFIGYHISCFNIKDIKTKDVGTLRLYTEYLYNARKQRTNYEIIPWACAFEKPPVAEPFKNFQHFMEPEGSLPLDFKGF